MRDRVFHLVLILAITLCMFEQLTIPAQGQVPVPNPSHVFCATVGTPESVDPYWAYDTASGELIQNIYEPLCAFDKLETGKFIAATSDYWSGYGVLDNITIPYPPDPSAPPGTAETWYFHIRTGIAWQDPAYGFLTPADVEYSFERGMFMDHTGGPMWMLYQPLLGVSSSDAYDTDANGNIDSPEWPDLYNAVTGAIGLNATHVWFNLVGSYAPFQQILCRTWSSVMCKQWCIDSGLWNPGAADLYAEFLRTHDPATDLLMNPAKAMGSGPYTLIEMDENPTTGWYRLARSVSYWHGWPAPGASGFVDYATVWSIEQWTNRESRFLSSDPNLQADICDVPKRNFPELQRPSLASVFTSINRYNSPYPAQNLDAVFFTYMVNSGPYTPYVGTTPRPDLFSDRHMRLAICHLLNFTTYAGTNLGGMATQSAVCMPPGTIYFNATKSKYNIDLVKAQAHLDLAWAGTVKAQGLTLTFLHDSGNTAREDACNMLANNLRILSWGPLAKLNIRTEGIPSANFLQMMKQRQLPVFISGRLADFPDPHDWFHNFMSTQGMFGLSQNVIYGLDPASMNWEAGYSPPYSSSIGGTVTEINGTYIDTLISTGMQTPNGPARQAIYEELMDIYHAEASQLPTVTEDVWLHERTWAKGWIGTYNENAIAPGNYFYTMWKASTWLGPVNIAPRRIRLSPESNITTWLINQSYWAPQQGKPWMKQNMTTGMTVPLASMTVDVERTSDELDPVMVYVTWNGITASEYNWKFGYSSMNISSGEELSFGPASISNPAPPVGNFEIWIKVYVVEDGYVNDEPAPDFDSGWSYVLGYCDINGDNVVEGKDFVLVKKAIPSLPGDPKWNWPADVNCDNIVNVKDYVLVKGMIPTVYAPA